MTAPSNLRFNLGTVSGELRSAQETPPSVSIPNGVIEAAEAYRNADFADNPNGYTVAPYVNADTTYTAFIAGAEYVIANIPSTKAVNQETPPQSVSDEEIQTTQESTYKRKTLDELAEPRTNYNHCPYCLGLGYYPKPAQTKARSLTPDSETTKLPERCVHGESIHGYCSECVLEAQTEPLNTKDQEPEWGPATHEMSRTAKDERIATLESENSDLVRRMSELFETRRASDEKVKELEKERDGARAALVDEDKMHRLELQQYKAKWLRLEAKAKVLEDAMKEAIRVEFMWRQSSEILDKALEQWRKGSE